MTNVQVQLIKADIAHGSTPIFTVTARHPQPVSLHSNSELSSIRILRSSAGDGGLLHIRDMLL